MREKENYRIYYIYKKKGKLKLIPNEKCFWSTALHRGIIKYNLIWKIQCSYKIFINFYKNKYERITSAKKRKRKHIIKLSFFKSYLKNYLENQWQQGEQQIFLSQSCKQDHNDNLSQNQVKILRERQLPFLEPLLNSILFLLHLFYQCWTVFFHY